jgi:hypothetical protein
MSSLPDPDFPELSPVGFIVAVLLFTITVARMFHLGRTQANTSLESYEPPILVFTSNAYSIYTNTWPYLLYVLRTWASHDPWEQCSEGFLALLVTLSTIQLPWAFWEIFRVWRDNAEDRYHQGFVPRTRMTRAELERTRADIVELDPGERF